MNVCLIKRKLTSLSLSFTLAIITALLITSFVFADSDDLPAALAENEPAAAESGGEAEAPSVETPGEAQPAEEAAEPAEESGGDDESPQDEPPAAPEGETGDETEPPQDESEPGEETQPPQDEGEAVDDVGAEPVDETEAVVSPAEEPCQESSAPQMEMPVEELETTLLEPAEVEETTDSIVDAAQLTGGGDPYWYVGGKKYAVVTNISLCPADAYQCWVSTTPIQDALDKIEEESLLPTDKKLYVLAGIYTEDISFEGDLLRKMTGLIGIDGSAATIINGDIYFPELTSGFTLSGFTINGGVQMDSQVAGNITLQDLDIQNTDGPGIMIGEPVYDDENEWWSYYVNRGNVTLTDVNSSGNADAGAVIARIGNIKISDSTFNNNDLSGLSDEDFNQGALVVLAFMSQKAELVNVTANGNIANEGIHVYAGAGVILNNVTANSNQAYDGIYVYSGTTANVTNVTTNENVGGIGLYVYARTSATLNQVIAQGNDGGEFGEPGILVSSNTVTLKNILASGTINGDGIHVSAYSGKATLENIVSNDNDFSGLTVYGWGGTKPVLTVKNVTANGNGEKGLWIDTEGGVNVTNSLTDDNVEDGLYIVTSGVVKLTTVRSSGNAGNGLMISGQEVWEYDEELDEDYIIDILSPLVITITSPADPNFANIFDNNGVKGILIQSKNVVAISNFFARDNMDDGVRVEGICIDLDCVKSGAVTIKSAITGFRNEVSGNDGIGIAVEDSQGNVIVESTLVSGGENMGISIITLGAITLKDVKSNNNRESGLYLINSDALKAMLITLTNVEASGSLEYNGIYARSKGAITLNNVIANNNHWSGADLDNCLQDEESGLCLGSGSITITTPSGKLNTFNDNGRFGVWAVSKGAITVVNIQANGNGSDGTLLSNSFSGSSAGVTVAVSGLPRNEFNGNGWNSEYDPGEDEDYNVLFNGLSIISKGNISVKSITANDNQNGGGGIYAGNHPALSPKTLLISNCEVAGNDWFGVFALSPGNLTLTSITASENNSGGIYADNCLVSGEDFCYGVGSVILSNITSSANGGKGIEVDSTGIINLSNVTANKNYDKGIYLQNNHHISVAGISLKSITANGNNHAGMQMQTNGSVVMGGITANQNNKTEGYVSDGEIAQDYYNQNQGEEKWWFDVEAGTPYTIRMLADVKGVPQNLLSFDPYFELYDGDGSLITDGVIITHLEGDYYQLVFTPGSAASYYVLASNQDNHDGFFRLFVSGATPVDPDQDEPTRYYSDGLRIGAVGNVTLNGGTFNDNSIDGVYIYTDGTILVSNIGSCENGTEGIALFNRYGSGNITLAGNNLANFNGTYGLKAVTNGIVNVSNLETSNNYLDGINIKAYGNLKPVTLTGVTVNNNGENGLHIEEANGKVTLTGIRAWLNDGSGAVMDTNGNALLVQSSVFMCNGEYGLEYEEDALPVIFTDKSNVYFGNTSGATHKN